MNIFKGIPSPMGIDKKDLLEMLLREEYGYLPARPYSVSATVRKHDKRFCAGKADLVELILDCKAEWGDFSFPVYYVCPKGKQNVPCFIHINFRDLIPDMYQPTEEIVDNGFATLTFCYKDVSSDDGDFTNGIAGVVYPDGKRKPDDCGKIGLWAWAAMAVMDYAQTLKNFGDRSFKTRQNSPSGRRFGRALLLCLLQRLGMQRSRYIQRKGWRDHRGYSPTLSILVLRKLL